jgi:hypothetical protein
MIAIITGTLSVAALVAWFVSRPLLMEGVKESENIPSLKRQKEIDGLERCEQLLAELEFDHSLKTVSDEDYQAMRQSLEVELAERKKS